MPPEGRVPGATGVLVGLRVGTLVGWASPPPGVGEGRGLILNCALDVGLLVGKRVGVNVIPVGILASWEAVDIEPFIASLAFGERVGNETGGGGIRVHTDIPFCIVRVPGGH